MTKTAQKQNARDNHYVPQFYLKRWSTNGNSILDYQTIVHHPNEPEWKRSAIKTTACWKDLYTQYTDGLVNTEIETYFESNIETPAKRIFDKIDSNKSPSSRDMGVLVNYLIAQLFRTPYAMMKESNIIKNNFNKAIQKGAFDAIRDIERGVVPVSRLQALNESNCIPPFPPIPLKLTLDDQRSEMVVSTTAGRQSFLSSFIRLYNGRVGEMLRLYNWIIITMPAGIELPTSDNPVVVAKIDAFNHRIDLGAGTGTIGAIILLPLDTKRALFTIIGAPIESLLQFRPDSYYSNLLIEAVVHNAFQHVYAKTKLSEVPRIRPREINRLKAEEAKFTRQKWDEIQAKVDMNMI